MAKMDSGIGKLCTARSRGRGGKADIIRPADPRRSVAAALLASGDYIRVHMGIDRTPQQIVDELIDDSPVDWKGVYVAKDK